jgi:hypothetical protein
MRELGIHPGLDLRMASEAEGVPTLLEELLLVGKMGIVTAGAGAVLNGGMNRSL